MPSAFEEGSIMTLAPNHYEQGIADHLKHYEASHEMCPVPFPGIVELLKDLRNKDVYIARITGKGQRSTAISLRYLGLAGYFEVIETGPKEGPNKAEGIQRVIDRLENIKKQEIIYVGYDPGDIAASRKID